MLEGCAGPETRTTAGLETGATQVLFGRGSGSADGRRLSALIENGVRAAGAVVKNDQADGSAHEDDGRPGGEAREHVGGGARSEGGLRALSTEGAGEIGGAALLDENDTNQEETHQQVEDNDEVEENLHCEAAFQSRPDRPDLRCPDGPD